MQLRKFLYILIASIITVCAISYPLDADSAPRKSRTSQSSKSSSGKKGRRGNKSKSKSKGSKSKKSSSKKKKSGSKKSGSRTRSTARSYTPAPETPSYDSLTLLINKAVVDAVPTDINTGGLRVNSVKPDKRAGIARLSLNENFTYLPVTNELITLLRNTARKSLPDSLSGFDVTLNVGNRNLAYYINKIDKLPEQHRRNIPFVVPVHPNVNPTKGMEGDIVALWHSHGRYFRPGSSCWLWQRPVLFQTIEDIYTMSYILPFVTPMLENAGAYVMLPRERDLNDVEIIVDNDINPDGEVYSQTTYREMSGSKKWETGELDGFIYDLPDFRDTENPFENGTYRQVQTVRSGKPAIAAWYADIPKDGEYAIYISYKSLPNSTEDARYTVNYSGGSREFKVNQTMGGGTWIYLGTFPLKAGFSDKDAIVTLTNLSEKNSDRIVTADAIKIGGGMGNIARSNRRSDIYYDPSTPETVYAQNTSCDDSEEVSEEIDEENDTADNEDSEDEDIDDEDMEDEDSVDQEQEIKQPDNTEIQSKSTSTVEKKGPAPVFRTSGLPRFLEGARYWLQWAGAPENVYSPYHGSDDYKDDYTSRGNWVNWLAGGSRVLPGRKGLNIPVDVAVALHSDAGKRGDDSFVGTLGIYYTNGGDSYVDGTPRINSRMLTDMLMRQVTNDIRKTYEPRWTRRQMWDKSYVEARVPEVPTSLIELMSHQNYADMMYGLDPTFRFTVGRSMYKAIGRFISERKGREFIVQPLPVSDFAIQREKKGHYRLSWSPTKDELEPTAVPSKYIIMERTEGESGFHKIGETKANHFDLKVADDLIHSFKVIATNAGGSSFDSETLALRECHESNESPVLIINGFTRVSGPEHFASGDRAGFNAEQDFGVPYIKDISFAGYQQNFNRSSGESFGRSGTEKVSTVIGGNTFDYPALHGEGIADAGMGFVSTSLSAVEQGKVKLSKYKIIDLILGKQKSTVVGNGMAGVKFRTFTPSLREALADFTKHGGHLLISGQYVASDLQDIRNDAGSVEFAEQVLGVVPDESSERTRSGKVTTDMAPYNSGISDAVLPYSTTLRPDYYILERPEPLQAVEGVSAQPFLLFTDTRSNAGLLLEKGKSRIAVSSIPFEAVTDRDNRNKLISELINWLRK